MDRHVAAGKEELNFNEFATYSLRRRRSRLRAIGESLDEGSMPLTAYTLMHRNAILSRQDKALLTNWVEETNVRIVRNPFFSHQHKVLLL